MRRDVIIIGGGQSALSVAYFLRRTACSVLILDAEDQGGGAWQHAWESLRLFSPAAWISIAGWPMPSTGTTYPSRDDVVAYLRAYEARYALEIERPVWVRSVGRTAGGFEVRSDDRVWIAKAVGGGGRERPLWQRVFHVTRRRIPCRRACAHRRFAAQP